MTLTFELDLDIANMKYHHTKYLVKESKSIFRTHRHTHTHIGASALPGPLIVIANTVSVINK